MLTAHSEKSNRASSRKRNLTADVVTATMNNGCEVKKEIVLRRSTRTSGLSSPIKPGNTYTAPIYQKKKYKSCPKNGKKNPQLVKEAESGDCFIEITPPNSIKSQKINVNPFIEARRAFHRSGSFKIIGRIEEKAAITSFWYDTVGSHKGASIYISGNPGTGKTACVNKTLEELINSEGSDVHVIKLNCMMLKDPIKTFSEIYSKVKLDQYENEYVNENEINVQNSATTINPHLIISNLENIFTKNKNIFHVIVIDEIDQIGLKDSELLCKFLSIPYRENSKVAIIGIANCIDLTERFLPRLQILNCSPQILHFQQYSISDISEILFDRLERINEMIDVTVVGNEVVKFMEKSVIDLTARKVASTGDLRRALDLIRQSIDLAEEEYNNSPDVESKKELVKFSHVVRILDKFGSLQSGPLIILKSLNLHQKVILACILGFKSQPQPQPQNINRRLSLNPISTEFSHLLIQNLFEDYSSTSLKPPKLYEAVTRSEFIDLISNLESMSIIGKSTSDSQPQPKSSSASIDGIWKNKIFLKVPDELVKTMLKSDLPTISILFNL